MVENAQTKQQVNIIPADLLADRLDRMEEKLDKLSDAMISLARTEQKLISIEADRATLNERMNRHADRVENMQKTINEMNNKIVQNERLSQTINKLFWLIITAAATAGATFFVGMK